MQPPAALFCGNWGEAAALPNSAHVSHMLLRSSIDFETLHSCSVKAALPNRDAMQGETHCSLMLYFHFDATLYFFLHHISEANIAFNTPLSDSFS